MTPGLTCDDIDSLALAFDGYRAFGDGVFDLPDRLTQAKTFDAFNLDELRGALFAWPRQWRHRGWAPDVEEDAWRAQVPRVVAEIERRIAPAGDQRS